jgi:glycosyltransferase involved in cell wall biosynthesis
MVAKYRERKRHLDLLSALAPLAARLDFQLTFCGEESDGRDRDYCERLRCFAAKCGLESRLTFRNNVPHQEMWDVYRDHDLFILPSVCEPAAVSPLEAAWSGCAVIVARQSGTRSYLPPDITFDFRDGDVPDLERAISNILSSSSTLAHAQERCCRYINHIAGGETVVRRFERFL